MNDTYHKTGISQISAEQADTAPQADIKGLRARFNRIVGKTRAALAVERAVPLFVPPAVMSGAFLGASWLDIWTNIPHETRPYVLAGYLLATAASPLLIKGKNILVSRKEALRHLDNQVGSGQVGSGKEYPASALGAHAPGDLPPASQVAWDLQQEKLLKKWVPGFRAHRPSPSVPRYWAYALAASAALALGGGLAAGDQRLPRLQEAFNFTAPPVIPPPPDVRAWITPPKGFKGEKAQYLKQGQELAPVHLKSILNITAVGSRPRITLNGQEIEAGKTLVSSEGGVVTHQYLPLELAEGYNELRVEGGPSWVIDVTPDAAPKIRIDGADLGTGEESGLVLKCAASDDYGISGGTIILSLPENGAETASELNQVPPVARLPGLALPGGHFCEDMAPAPEAP